MPCPAATRHRTAGARARFPVIKPVDACLVLRQRDERGALISTTTQASQHGPAICNSDPHRCRTTRLSQVSFEPPETVAIRGAGHSP